MGLFEQKFNWFRLLPLLVSLKTFYELAVALAFDWMEKKKTALLFAYKTKRRQFRKERIETQEGELSLAVCVCVG